MSINKAELKEIKKEIDAALAKIGKKHNLTIKTQGKLTYGEDFFKVKVEGSRLTAEGESAKDKREWEENATFLGFKRTDFGRVFVYKDKSYKITRLDLNRSKYPIHAKGDDGQEYNFPAVAVINLLAGRKFNECE